MAIDRSILRNDGSHIGSQGPNPVQHLGQIAPDLGGNGPLLLPPSFGFALRVRLVLHDAIPRYRALLYVAANRRMSENHEGVAVEVITANDRISVADVSDKETSRTRPEVIPGDLAGQPSEA